MKEKISKNKNEVLEKEIKVNLGKKIKEMRLKRGKTQEELARLIGIQGQTLCQLERGNYFLSANVLGNLCKTLNVKPKELFNFDKINLTTKSSYIVKLINEELKSLSQNQLKKIYSIVKLFNEIE